MDLDLSALATQTQLAGLPAVDVRVPHDPVYGTPKRYRGWPLERVLALNRPLSGSELAQGQLLMTAADGYVTRAMLRSLPLGRGVLAFRDLDAPPGKKWIPVHRGKETLSPGPYYLVWEGTDGTEDLPRPYELMRIVLRLGAGSSSRAAPRGGSAKVLAGFSLFEHQCLKCHSLNLQGGTLGPELNVPKNVTEYWREPDLRAYVRHPDDFHAGSRMPSFASLSDDELASLLAYLRYMKGEKICSDARSCAALKLVP